MFSMWSRDGCAERTHEEVVCFRALTADVEKLEQIPKLTMNITTYLTRDQCQSEIHTTRERTVTGESTTWTFPSSINISLALRQSCLTSSSVIGSQRWS